MRVDASSGGGAPLPKQDNVFIFNTLLASANHSGVEIRATPDFEEPPEYKEPDASRYRQGGNLPTANAPQSPFAPNFSKNRALGRGTNKQRRSLTAIALMANRLGHEAKGELQSFGFRIKLDAVSEMLGRGWAPVNCKRPDNTLGITINRKPALHVPLHRLTPEARLCVDGQLQSLRVTTPLREFVKPGVLESLSVTGGK